nr:hypothetical protein [Tanacetum cinerariifolium]
MKKRRILMRVYGVTSSTALHHNIFKERYVTQQDYGVTTCKDPIDYHADRGDDEEEKSFEDDDEEGKHLALADSAALPAINTVPLAGKTKPFETDESAATPPP